MNLSDVPDGTGTYPFDGQADTLSCMALVAHLGDNAGVASGLGDFSCLPNAVCEWFFAKDVLFVVDGPDRRRCMVVVWCTYQDRIDILFFVEHSAKIHILGAGPVILCPVIICIVFLDDFQGGHRPTSSSCQRDSVFSATSQTAITCTLEYSRSCFISTVPCPPAPITATLSFSEGALNPVPPRTYRGRTVKPAVAAVEARKLRREIFGGVDG